MTFLAHLSISYFSFFFSILILCVDSFACFNYGFHDSAFVLAVFALDDLWIFHHEQIFFVFLPQCIPSSAGLDWERRCRRPTDIDRTPTSFPCTRCTSCESSCERRAMREQTFSCHRCHAFPRLRSARRQDRKKWNVKSFLWIATKNIALWSGKKFLMNLTNKQQSFSLHYFLCT